MARNVVVTLVDDLDATKTADETVEFGLDGVTYEIDLAADNAAELRDSLDKWVGSARRSGGRKRVKSASIGTSPRGHAPIDRAQSQVIREWARKTGRKVNERGRISQEVIDAFNEAN